MAAAVRTGAARIQTRGRHPPRATRPLGRVWLPHCCEFSSSSSTSAWVAVSSSGRLADSLPSRACSQAPRDTPAEAKPEAGASTPRKPPAA